MKILHISDLHIKQVTKTWGIPDEDQIIFRLLKSIKERYPAHYLVVTGDITDNGSQEEYEQALAALWPFKGRLFGSPGNHDYRYKGNFIDPKKAARYDEMISIPLNQHGFFFGDNIPIVNRVGDTLFIALDSNLEMDIPYYPFEFACGEIGPRQLTELDEILTRSNEKTKIVFLHHHPFIRNSPFMKLKDADKLKEIISERVDVLLFGHRHHQEYWQGRWGIPHILAAGKASRESTVGEITIENGEIEVNYVEV